MKIEIKTDFDKFAKWLKDLAGKQMPFVAAKSLTHLGTEVNRAAQGSLRSYFTIRNNYVQNSFRLVMAKYRDWPNCQSQAGSIFPQMDLQVEGGEKREKHGVRLGVPMARGQYFGARPTKESIIKNPYWVERLLKKMRYFEIPGKIPVMIEQRRVATRRNKKLKGTPGWKKRKHRPHTGKRGWSQKPMYLLKKEVKILPRFPFQSIASKTIEQRYEEIFRKNLNEALEKRST